MTGVDDLSRADGHLGVDDRPSADDRSDSGPAAGAGGGTRRRTYLNALGTAAVACSGGCLSGVRSSLSPPARLGWVAVGNYSADPQRCEVQVVRAGTVVHESSHEIPGREEDRRYGDVLDCTWGDERGPYTLRGRVAGGEWAEVALDEAFDDPSVDCVIAEGRLHFSTPAGRLAYEADGFSWWPQDDWCDSVPSYEGGCPFANEET